MSRKKEIEEKIERLIEGYKQLIISYEKELKE